MASTPSAEGATIWGPRSAGWWKRYRKGDFFARGIGEFRTDGDSFLFRRHLTKRPLSIPFESVVDAKIGRSHAGRWLIRGRG